MNLYKKCARPFLFKLNREAAHNIAKVILECPFLSHVVGRKALFVRNERLRVNLDGISICDPVGLAPGFEKDCEMLSSLEMLGFGYIVPGSVMCQPRPENPRPPDGSFSR